MLVEGKNLTTIWHDTVDDLVKIIKICCKTLSKNVVSRLLAIGSFKLKSIITR